MKTISVARDFSMFPAGRYETDNLNSGERFRELILVPSLKEHDKVTVLLDGTMGYGSSFLDEAFGGLVRENNYNPESLHEKLTIESLDDPSLVTESWSYIELRE